MNLWDRATFLGFVLLTLNQPLTFASTIEKKPEEYWKATPLSFDLLKNFLNEQNCYASKTNFIGCVQAISVLGAFAAPVQILVTPKMAGSDATAFGKTTHVFGAVSAVEYLSHRSEDSDGPLKIWKKEKAKKDLQIRSLSQVFAKGKATDVDFGAIIDYFAGLIPKDGKEAMIAAGAINTYYSSAVDPHTHINPKKEIEDQSNATGSSFFGVGANLQRLGGKIIMTPMPGGPALKAGLRAQDVLLEVDGKKIEGMDLEKVVDLIRGPKGTAVTLIVSRKGKSVPLTVIRDQIVVQNVSSRVVEDRGTKYGYIKLKSFMEGTSCEEVYTNIVSLLNQQAEALILDLRGNGGGLLDQALCIGGLFVGPNQIIALVKDLDKDEMVPLPSPTWIQATDLPLVTLIDSGSASASEILAGALQDYKRAWIAGARSFGKATVQGPSDWLVGKQPVDGVSIYRTSKRFYQPTGRTNQVVGIEPDFALDPKPNATEEDRFSLHESDEYTNYLPSVGPKWTEPRPEEVSKIQSCVASTGQATQLYAQHLEDAISPDYQILAAEDLLACATGTAGQILR